MTHTYWLNVFTVETWDEFRKHGASVSGFPKRRRNTVNRMRKGDYLLCYVMREKRWVGVLEVIGSAYEDDARIWSTDTYPARIPVKAIIALDVEQGVPITEMRDELSIFDDANSGGWGTYLQGAPKIWDPADGEAVLQVLQRALDNPTSRPLLRKRSQSPPQEQLLQPIPAQPDENGLAEDVIIPEEAVGEEGASKSEVRIHTEIQYQLVRMGSEMGFETHIARNDRNIVGNRGRLGDIDGLIEDLRLPFDKKTNETIELIDVLWLDSGQIVAAFEIESTTSIYSGLLRMSDLLAMNPNLEIRLYLVAPESRREKVKEQVNRPTFARLPRKPLVKVCRYISFEKLTSELKQHRKVIRHMKIDWIEDDVSVSCAKKD